jgi:NADPH:quinone reductase-like Zn-dependent oxidoreductase
LTKVSFNSGDDVAGYVEALGSQVAATHEFKVGDRVAAFHPMMEQGGTYAEYALAPVTTTFLIPDGVSFEC